MDGSNGEVEDLTNRLVDREGAYRLKVSTGKSKIVTNRTKDIRVGTRICKNGHS